MGFTKLDEGILRSSIMAEDPTTFKVWIALLAACKQDGIADVSAVFLASVCHMDIKTIHKVLDRLQMPDPNSRSMKDQGKRITRIDGGFEIINYFKYREKSLNEVEAERKRRQREKGNVLDSPGQSGTSPGRSASASSSASSLNRGDVGGGNSLFEELWKAWPIEGRFKKTYCRMKFNAVIKAGKLEEYKATHRGYLQYLEAQEIDNNFKQKAMHLSTFLDNWEGDKERYMNFRRKPRL